MFYFAPKTIYETQEQSIFNDIKDDVQYRSLTRNSNSPYTDYGSYWEAMVVRAPFSDSFINDQELQSFEKLTHLRKGLTPNWNMVYLWSMIHGYTTLLPRDFALFWSKSPETDINFIDYIDPTDSKLQDWAVKYYLVDTLYEIKEEIPFLELAREGNFILYELPNSKARFRFSNDSAVDLQDFQENPNQITFKFNNSDQDYLIIADRYDRNWQVWINGKQTTIENFNGMRKIAIEAGENSIIMRFVPKTFYWGLGISFVTSLGMIIYFRLLKKIK